MSKFLSIIILFAPFIFLSAGKETTKALVNKKEAVEKVALSRKTKLLFSYTTSIIISFFMFWPVFLIHTYAHSRSGELPKGFFGDKYLNIFVFALISSIVGSYCYLALESFLSKQKPSAIGKLFSYLILLLISSLLMELCYFCWKKKIPSDLKSVAKGYETGLLLSLNTLFFNRFIYKEFSLPTFAPNPLILRFLKEMNWDS